ncbi:hypothetical protein AVEN_33673-1 [Araneus ventricosus]|uniref:DUF4817 domain-containing protein n=1 Tax=Araneus ventricosus TaxID=182803 RepID=A0A4Y2SJK5_ARAVE|nr:hypothetical protein AVEN_29560-1 [Araneus ventricosus]GBN88392.1 hypothetical protein AVEN_33673-1 [Araneus ventricosus]
MLGVFRACAVLLSSFFVENVEIQRISIVTAYYWSSSSQIAAQRKFATEYKLKTTDLSVKTIKNAIEKYERTGSVDVSTLQRFLKNFALRQHHVIGKHIEHVIN